MQRAQPNGPSRSRYENETLSLFDRGFRIAATTTNAESFFQKQKCFIEDGAYLAASCASLFRITWSATRAAHGADAGADRDSRGRVEKIGHDVGFEAAEGVMPPMINAQDAHDAARTGSLPSSRSPNHNIRESRISARGQSRTLLIQR